MDQKMVVYLQNRILGNRKKEAPILQDSMDGSGGHYAKWNKPGVERQISYDLTYKWNLIKQTIMQNITRYTEIKNKLTLTRGSGEWDNGEKLWSCCQ